jgi:serine/threonine protein kinase
LDSKRWQKLDELFNVALERRSERRAAYVATVCAGDDELRQELEAMLAHHDRANSFIESPAYVVAAQNLFEDDVTESLIGRTIGPYHIRSLLGSGGMGIVYLAFDQELHRQVALKFLPNDLLFDKQRVQRFKQEARAASALNHPNILTIHQIGEVDARQFIATEFVEGETLRTLLKRKQLSLIQTLDIATQIASALSAAHAADIVHRDIKPENVMVRPDGYVKILDFGLAKLAEGPKFGSEHSTLLDTEQGAIIGTIQYMSPEQARGQAVDARTDIWSLGVVLYEMLTAHAPFGGETNSDVIAAILEREPLPLMHYEANLAPEVQLLVTRSLGKDRELRYQTAKDLLSDLRVLKQRLELRLSSDSSALTKPLTSRPGSEDDNQRTSSTVETARTSQASSAEYLVGEIKQHKLGVGALLGLILAVTVISAVYFRSSRLKSVAQLPSMSMTRFVTSEQVHTAAISPDGKSVAYVVGDKGCCFRESVRLRHVDTGSDLQIDPPSSLSRKSLTFSPEGNYIYFTDGADDLYRMPALGGPKTRLLGGVSTPISFSPDGKRITFVRRDYPTPDETSLMLANSDGTREEKVASRKKPDFFDGGPSWSPIEPAIACGAGSVDDRGRYLSVIEFRLDGREQRLISAQRWANIARLAWLSDGSGLLMLAEDRASIFSPQIWQLSSTDGNARRLTNELGSYDNLSVSADSTRALIEQTAQPSSIWTAKPGEPREITSGVKGSYESVSWLSDKYLVFDSNNSGQWEVWRLDIEDGTRTQLSMNAGANGDAAGCADGRFIVFVSNRAGAVNIWRMDSDGANPKQLTSGDHQDDYPRCTPDGKWVVYESTRAEKTTLWKVPFEGGEPVQLVDQPAKHAAISPDGRWVLYDSTDAPKGLSFRILPDGSRIADDPAGERTIWKVSIEGGNPKPFVNRYNLAPIISRKGNLMEPVISPDGKLIACRYQPNPEENIWKVAIISLDGIPVQIFDIAAHPFWDRVGFQWSPDSKAITYRGYGSSGDNLWSQPIDGGLRRQLTNFNSEQIFFFGWSPNGQLALSRGVETRDVILMTNFK